ncbi:MAG: hypothetical protein COV36_08130 [Alphaproteobacteria bacterium CG11_big_fil_rev_8_21_14_0_20_44_7]|nr:MAG: hypothetical protein COV36_08130 [Alphaproteobacteria bacterium CG11_big_fil_rev_8_21_14_0_20_44_7]
MGSKNNPAARGTAGGVKKIGGKPIKPVKYIGKYVGHGNYIAGQTEAGQLIESDGVPTPYSDIIPDSAEA